MAQQHLPNGVPPQLFAGANSKPSPQFNGVNSAHSSRDSSPSARLAGQIPASQLPPGRGGPVVAPQITRASPIVQKMGQLNVAGPSPKFSTSTPNQSLHSAGLVGSAFSPILQGNVPQNSTQLPKVTQQPQQQKVFTPATANDQFETIPLTPTSGQIGGGRPPEGGPGQSNLSNHFRQTNSVPQQQPPSHNNHRQEAAAPLTGQNQGRPPQIQPQFVGRGQPPPPLPKQAAPAPPLHPHPPPGRMPTSASQPQLSQYQHQNASPIPPFQTQSQSSSPFPPHQQPQQQAPPQFSSQGSAGGTLTLNRPPPPLQQQAQQQQQFKTNVHTNRYPQGPVTGSLPPPLQQPQSFQQQPLAPQPQQQLQQPSFHQPANNLQQHQYQPQQQPSFQQQQQQQRPAQPPPSHGFQQQLHQAGYVQQQQNSVTNSGFNRLWGQDSFDLLQNPNVLPPEKVAPAKIRLGQESLDAANCSPEVFRCTMTKIPESSSLLQKSRLPLGVLIHPFKDMTYLTVIQSETIVRCRACRTYINPFVFFVDSKRWKCNLCYRINELPEEFMYDPVSRTYGDPSRRPEIKMATVEYIAPAEYMLRPPQPAMYLFLFDVSRLAVESGYLQSVCGVLSEQLKNLPGDARTQIGIVAYDSAIHFYSMGEGLSQPHEMTILDIDDVFLPCPDNLLVNLKDRSDLLTDLLTQLPNRFNQTYDNNSALGAALQVAHKMMGATGGRVTVFQASLPNVGPGALQSREDPSQRASSEVSHLNPANDFYKRLALECSAQQIAVDLFVLNSQYVDIATLSGISRFSGGCIHHYPLFKASKVLVNERFERELRRYLTRKIGFEAVMRIRCTRGLSIHTFHGNFFVRSTDLLSLPNINPDAGFGMQVSIDDNLSDVQSVCFQAALLYTSSRGERRIRVHTICLPICATLSDVINSADQQCIVGLLAKMAVDRSMMSSLSDAREAFINVAIDTLSSYKLSLNMGSAQSGLLAAQCMRLLPLYISALLKHVSFRIGTSTRLDDRVKAMIDMKTKPLFQLIQMIYPDLYPVHNLEEQKVIVNGQDEQVSLPPLMQLTARCLDSKGAFLMDTGEHMIMLVSPGVSSTFLNEALGVRDYVSISDEMYELPILDNPHNQRLHQFIAHLNDEKPFPATLHVVRDNSPHRVQFFERLIEDRVENALSYHEFLQHLKTQVK